MVVNNSTTRRSRLRPVLGAAVTAAAATALVAFAPGTATADPLPATGSLGSVSIDIPATIITFFQPFTNGSLGNSSGSLGSVAPSGSLGSTSTGSFGSSYGSVIDSPLS